MNFHIKSLYKVYKHCVIIGLKTKEVCSMNEKKIILFHNPWEENGYLSNWYISKFKVDGIEFSSMEQYMMYNKAVLFEDKAAAERILKTDDCAEIKGIGREVKWYRDSVWAAKRYNIVRTGALEKFNQNSNLMDMLLSTGGSILAEAAVHDKIWGIGLSMTDKRSYDIDKWRGQNLLGKCLMDVREMLKGQWMKRESI